MRAIFKILTLLMAMLAPLQVEAQPEVGTEVTPGGLTRLPVEVVSQDGSESQREWVLVEVSGQAIPEPEAAVLVLLAGLLLLRRGRR